MADTILQVSVASALFTREGGLSVRPGTARPVGLNRTEEGAQSRIDGHMPASSTALKAARLADVPGLERFAPTSATGPVDGLTFHGFVYKVDEVEVGA